MILRCGSYGFSGYPIVLNNLSAIAGTKWISHPGSHFLLPPCLSLVFAARGITLPNMLHNSLPETLLGKPRVQQMIMGPFSAYTMRRRVAQYKLPWVQLHCRRWHASLWDEKEWRYTLPFANLQLARFPNKNPHCLWLYNLPSPSPHPCHIDSYRIIPVNPFLCCFPRLITKVTQVSRKVYRCRCAMCSCKSICRLLLELIVLKMTFILNNQ